MLYTLPIATAVTFCQDSDIKDIRDQYAEIRNHLKNYLIKKNDVQGVSTEGATLTAYFDDTLIRLIVAEYPGETGKRVIEYYYTNQRIFFIYNVTINYNRPIYFDSLKAVELNDTEWYDPSKSTKTEERFYFKNNRLIRWVDKAQQTVSLKSDQLIIKEREWIGMSNDVLSGFFNNDQ